MGGKIAIDIPLATHWEQFLPRKIYQWRQTCKDIALLNSS
jgi:hypothetical protein